MSTSRHPKGLYLIFATSTADVYKRQGGSGDDGRGHCIMLEE